MLWCRYTIKYLFCDKEILKLIEFSIKKKITESNFNLNILNSCQLNTSYTQGYWLFYTQLHHVQYWRQKGLILFNVLVTFIYREIFIIVAKTHKLFYYFNKLKDIDGQQSYTLGAHPTHTSQTQTIHGKPYLNEIPPLVKSNKNSPLNKACLF